MRLNKFIRDHDLRLAKIIWNVFDTFEPFSLISLFASFGIHLTNFDIFNNFAQNTDCGYTLEPPRRGGSYEYPQSMFSITHKKKGISLQIPVFSYKSGA